MQTGCKKAPCWQHMKLGNTFTLPMMISLGSKWRGRAFSLDTHIKGKLHLENQKQVITVISFLITSLNSPKSAILHAHFIRLWMKCFETPTLSSLQERSTTKWQCSYYDQPFKNVFLLFQDFFGSREIFHTYCNSNKMITHSFFSALQRRSVTQAVCHCAEQLRGDGCSLPDPTRPWENSESSEVLG